MCILDQKRESMFKGSNRSTQICLVLNVNLIHMAPIWYKILYHHHYVLNLVILYDFIYEFYNKFYAKKIIA